MHDQSTPMSDTHFLKIQALCNAAREFPAGIPVEIGCEAWKATYRQLPELQVNEVAQCFKELCGANQKKKREEIGAGGIEPPTSC